VGLYCAGGAIVLGGIALGVYVSFIIAIVILFKIPARLLL
jgi:hypothetical protein